MAGPPDAASRSVFLLRHAKSSWDDAGLDDHDRPLSERGVRAARLIGHHLGAQRASIQLVLCSSAVRARQTLDHILGSIGSPEVRIDPDIYLADAGELAHRLREVEVGIETVLLVGHNPAMHALAGFLVGDGEAGAVTRLRQKFPTAGLATVTIPADWRNLEGGCGYLQSFVVPKELPPSRGS